MSRIRAVASFAAIALALGATSIASAEPPAIARVRPAVSGQADAKGLAFFVPVPDSDAVVAVGTAHTFPIQVIAHASHVDFVTGHTLRTIARATRFFAPPGVPFHAEGGSIRDDFVAYLLDAPPQGARLLEPETDPLQPGARVKLYGVPLSIPHDEDDLFGRVSSASDEKIEIDLDVPYDLRGWGGAPVVLRRSGRVLGLLQAVVPHENTSRVIATPISAVLAALARPLDRGAGRAFAAFAEGAEPPSSLPQPIPEVGPRAAAVARPGPRDASGRVASTRRSEPLLRQEDAGTQIHLEVEYPAAGAVVTDTMCGVFVSGRAFAHQGELRRFDVALVLDTSRSTVEATGADINGNGVIGAPRLGRVGSIFGAGSSDPGDSILAAEVAAARQLLRGLDPRTTRVAVIAFAGDSPDAGGPFSGSARPPAVTIEPLSGDFRVVDRALDDLLEQGPDGATHMAAGVDQATIELLGLRGSLSQEDPDSEKVVFFFTDGQPTLPYGPGFEADNVRAVLRAASRAHRGGVRIHSFAIGPDALEGPIAVVEMAQRTNGFFTPVRHPGDLVNVVEEVSFANLSDLVVRSAATGEAAYPFRTTADGSWSGLLRMEPGENEIEIIARADDGTEARQKIDVTFVPEGTPDAIPNEFVVQRNRLLEDCLRNLKQLRVEAEEERAEQVRRNLLVEIEKERQKARDRAAEQRKELELGVEHEDLQGPLDRETTP